MYGIHFGPYMSLDGLLSLVLMFYPCFFMVLERLHFYLVFFSCFGLLFLHTLGFVFGFHFCALLPRKIHLFLQNIVSYDAWHTACACGNPINSQKIHLLLNTISPRSTNFSKNLGSPPRAQPRIFKNLGRPQRAQPRNFKNLGHPSFSEFLCFFWCSFLWFF